MQNLDRFARKGTLTLCYDDIWYMIEMTRITYLNPLLPKMIAHVAPSTFSLSLSLSSLYNSRYSPLSNNGRTGGRTGRRTGGRTGRRTDGQKGGLTRVLQEVHEDLKGQDKNCQKHCPVFWQNHHKFQWFSIVAKHNSFNVSSGHCTQKAVKAVKMSDFCFALIILRLTVWYFAKPKIIRTYEFHTFKTSGAENYILTIYLKCYF